MPELVGDAKVLVGERDGEMYGIVAGLVQERVSGTKKSSSGSAAAIDCWLFAQACDGIGSARSCRAQGGREMPQR